MTLNVFSHKIWYRKAYKILYTIRELKTYKMHAVILIKRPFFESLMERAESIYEDN